MKAILFSLVVAAISVANVQAAQNVSVNIDGITYSCSQGGGGGGGGFVDCDRKAEAFRQNLNTCVNGSGGQSATWCVQNLWPRFKSANPTCIDEGSSVCIHTCTNGSGGQSATWCVQFCQ